MSHNAMTSILVETNITGKPSIYSLEIISGSLVLVDASRNYYSSGYALRPDVSKEVALNAFLENPVSVREMLNEKTKYIGGGE